MKLPPSRFGAAALQVVRKLCSGGAYFFGLRPRFAGVFTALALVGAALAGAALAGAAFVAAFAAAALAALPRPPLRCEP